MVAPTNDKFLTGLFGAAAPNAHVTSFEEPPGELPKLGRNHYWAGRKRKGYRDIAHFDRGNSYFTISTFKDDPVSGRQVRRRKLFEATYVIVVDDVGTKVQDTSKLLPPSYVLETSPGNFQWGYILEMPERDANRVDALLNGMVALGLCPDSKDPGMKGVTRYVRLPGGRNTKTQYGAGGFQCRLIEWNPGRRYTLAELAQPWGIALQAEGAAAKTVSTNIGFDADGDEILKALTSWGMVLGDANDEGFFPVLCPWIEEHTDAPESGSAYKPGGKYKCFHGHCLDKHRRRELSRWVHDKLKAEGGSGLTEWAFKPVPGAATLYQPACVTEYLDELWRLLVLGQAVTSQDAERMHLACVPDNALDGLLRAARVILGANTTAVRREIRRARRKIDRQARRAHRDETKRALGAVVPMPEGALPPISLQDAHAALATQLAGLFPAHAAGAAAP